MGRPPTKPKRFKDGFYIEVRNKGAGIGMKIHFETLREMEAAAAMYGNGKEVIILGEHRKDRWLNEESSAKAPKTPKAQQEVKPVAKAPAESKALPASKKATVEKPAKAKPAAKKPAPKPAKKATKPVAKAKKPAGKK